MRGWELSRSCLSRVSFRGARETISEAAGRGMEAGDSLVAAARVDDASGSPGVTGAAGDADAVDPGAEAPGSCGCSAALNLLGRSRNNPCEIAMPRKKKTNATQVQTTTIVPHLRNCSDRNGCDASAGDTGDSRDGRLTCGIGTEDTGEVAASIFSSPTRLRSACAEESGSLAGWAESFSEREESGCEATVSECIEECRELLKAV